MATDHQYNIRFDSFRLTRSFAAAQFQVHHFLLRLIATPKRAVPGAVTPPSDPDQA
jgi:hypothetical protein